MDKMNFDIFISYRRAGGEIIGRLLFEMLKGEYNVFFDHESLSSGRFDTKLLNIIESAKDVVFILSPGCFDRCGNPGDWFMQEINCALENSKNIILLMTEDFIMPSEEQLKHYPKEITTLVRYNGHALNIAYLDGVIAKLKQEFKSEPKTETSLFDSLEHWHAISQKLADRKYAELLPSDIKAAILHNSVGCFFDEYNGQILDSVVTKMLNGAGNVRTKYRYEVELDTSFDFDVLDIDCDKYNKLAETFYYQKKYISSKPDREFWISFVTNLDELDGSLRDENFFFSENLTIEREDMLALCTLDEEDRRDFYLSAMRARINVNGKVLNPVQIIMNESGIFAKYKVTEDIPFDDFTLDVKIRFKIPQKKGDTYFFASINEPTYSPSVRFTYPEEDFDVMMIPFLSRSVNAKETKVFDGLRELSIDGEWILPISGTVFIIDDKQRL